SGRGQRDLAAVHVVVRRPAAGQGERAPLQGIPLQQLDQPLTIVADNAGSHDRLIPSFSALTRVPGQPRRLARTVDTRLPRSDFGPTPYQNLFGARRSVHFIHALSGVGSRRHRRRPNHFLCGRSATTSWADQPEMRRLVRTEGERDPVGPFLHYLMAECGVSAHTLAAYRSDLMRFIRWRRAAAPGPLSRLDVASLRGYVESLSDSGLAPTSVCRHLASLSTFFRFLVLEGRLTDNVAKLLVAPAVWDRLPTVLSPGAVERLLAVPNIETRLGRRDRAVLETLYATGCRAS